MQSMKSNSGYGQQNQQVFDEVINQGGYGQQQQQQQPSFDNFANEGAYGQQKQKVRTANSGYGQQQFDMPAVQPVQSGYG